MNLKKKETFAKIIAVCKSSTTGSKKLNVMHGTLLSNYGLLGDAHADNRTHRQLSLLRLESIEKMRDLGLDVNPGDFAENITTEDMEFTEITLGTRITLGNNSILEVTQIGKECNSPCEIGRQAGQCIMPDEGIFCKVLEGGEICVGDELRVI